MFGLLIGLFVGMWALQIGLTALQLKHYKKTVQEMSKRSSGYLGVGVDKRKLGVGSVVILVCNKDGIVVDSKKMYGVTVFQRFSHYNELIDKHIDHIDLREEDKLYAATQLAVKNIKTQINTI